MASRLARLANDDRILENPFANKRRAAALAARPRPDGREARTQADIRLAREQLRAGDTQSAIVRLTQLEANLGSAIDPALHGQLRRLQAIAHFRLGEQENCIAGHHATACLVPTPPSAHHMRPEGALRAQSIYAELLRDDPSDQDARWLFNLAAMTLGEYPDDVPADWRVDAAAFQSEAPLPAFPNVAPERGADVSGLAGGVVLDDLDGDGDLDAMVSSWGVEDPLTVLLNDGQGRFTPKVDAGLDGITGGLNLIHADYDNDGDIDVLVLRGAWLAHLGRHPNSLLRNDGTARFEDVTESAGLLSFRPTQTAAWADFDRDGWLDLFVGNESTSRATHPSALYRSRGDGTFEEIAAASGVADPTFVKGVTWGDVDNDGWLDLYLSTMGGPNRLFRNCGAPKGEGWCFEDVTESAGVGGPDNGFPTWFFDVDNDGWLDLFAGAYGAEYLTPAAFQVAADYLGVEDVASSPHLYRNRGDGTFDDITESARLQRSLMAMGANYGDLDNDGLLDLYVGTGAPNFVALAPNRMFLNRALDEGRIAFGDVTTAGGFGHIQKGHGIAFGDVDADGDQDIYAVMGGAFSGDGYPNALFENPGSGHRWLILRLEGVDSNRAAIGARIRVDTETAAGSRSVHAMVSTGGSFGASSLQQEIGLGDAESITRIEILWPNGNQQTFDDATLDRVYRVREGEEALREAIRTRSVDANARSAGRPER